MLQDLPNSQSQIPACLPARQASAGMDKIAEAILSTLAFFSLYNLPLHKRRIYELLYKYSADEQEVYRELEVLAREGRLTRVGDNFGLKFWDTQKLDLNLVEAERRWEKIDKYFWLLSIIPYIDCIDIVHSLAFGNADRDSDIDFFVVTKPRRLYFVRSLIIVLFKLIGVYKTRARVREQFCFGYFITTKHLSLESMLLPEDDPFMAFWVASHIPIYGRDAYNKFSQANLWAKDYFPNYNPDFRTQRLKASNSFLILAKKIIEIILWIPAEILEPVLRSIHIKHTFSLPENHWKTSSTVANNDMLKLHAIDARESTRKALRDQLSQIK